MGAARLENWQKYGNQLHGFIYDDSEGRCEDGTEGLTSILLPMSMQVSSPKEGVEVFTRNTTYLLGKPYTLEEEK